MAKRYNITTSRNYTQNNEEKKAYPNVGSLVKFEATSEKPEGFILELNMFPGTKFYVFEEKPRDGAQISASKPGIDLPTIHVDGVEMGGKVDDII